MNTKVRLAVMNFLEFAVWGAYLTCMVLCYSRNCFHFYAYTDGYCC